MGMERITGPDNFGETRCRPARYAKGKQGSPRRGNKRIVLAACLTRASPRSFFQQRYLREIIRILFLIARLTRSHGSIEGVKTVGVAESVSRATVSSTLDFDAMRHMVTVTALATLLFLEEKKKKRRPKKR